MASDDGKGEVLLTRSQIEAWKNECRRIDAEVAHLKAKRGLIERKLEAARFLFEDIDTMLVRDGPTHDTKTKTERSERNKATWTSEIYRIVLEAGKPLDYEELRERISQGPMADRLRQSDKGLYGGVGKLEKRGKIVKHRGWLFADAVYRDFQSRLRRGEIEDVPENETARKSPVGEVALQFILRHPEGVTSREIIAELRRHSEFVDQIDRNPTYAYNVFSRLVGRKQVRKAGKRYYPPQNGEPPGSGSHSVGGEAHTSSTERQSSFDIGGPMPHREADLAPRNGGEGG